MDPATACLIRGFGRQVPVLKIAHKGISLILVMGIFYSDPTIRDIIIWEDWTWILFPSAP